MKKPFNMRARREELNLTLEQVAARAGVTASAVRQMEVGAFEGHITTRHKIADALEVPLRFLFSNEERAAFAAMLVEGEGRKKRKATTGKLVQVQEFKKD